MPVPILMIAAGLGLLGLATCVSSDASEQDSVDGSGGTGGNGPANPNAETMQCGALFIGEASSSTITNNPAVRYFCQSPSKKGSTPSFQTDGERPNDHDKEWRLKFCQWAAAMLLQNSPSMDEAMRRADKIEDQPTIQYWSNKDERLYPYTFGDVRNGVKEALQKMKKEDARAADSPASQDKTNATVSLDGRPLTPEVLKNIPTDGAAGRFLHFVGEATSILDLYDKIAASEDANDKQITGIFRKEDIRKWEQEMKTNPSFKIDVSEDEKAVMEDLRRALGRNVKSVKKDQSQLADEFFDGDPKDKDDDGILEFIRLANDPLTNVRVSTHNRESNESSEDPGADSDTKSLNTNEINALVEYLELKDFKDEKTKEVKTKEYQALEFIAAYKTIVAYYREARKTAGGK